MRLLWEDRAWTDYLYWQRQDRKTLKRINVLINEIKRNPFEGIGKPEPLKREPSMIYYNSETGLQAGKEIFLSFFMRKADSGGIWAFLMVEVLEEEDIKNMKECSEAAEEAS